MKGTLQFDRRKIDIYVALLSAPVLLTIYWYHGYAADVERFAGWPGGEELKDLYKSLWQFFLFFVLLFLLPLLWMRIRRLTPITRYGFGLGDWRFGLKVVAAALPLAVVPLAYLASSMADVQSEYPLCKLILTRHDLALGFEAAYVLFFYVAWEFYFRGYLLFSLKEEFGAMGAVLIQTISSCLIHLGKPEGEILGAIPAGIVFGLIALRTRSFWYVFVLHAALGVCTDLFLLMRT
jgi:membrane protease YdiL (CAAX protease family)